MISFKEFILHPEERSHHHLLKSEKSQDLHHKRIYCGNYIPSYQDLPEEPLQGPADCASFQKFATLDEARQIVQSTASSNDGSYLLIPVKFIG